MGRGYCDPQRECCPPDAASAFENVQLPWDAIPGVASSAVRMRADAVDALLDP